MYLEKIFSNLYGVIWLLVLLVSLLLLILFILLKKDKDVSEEVEKEIIQPEEMNAASVENKDSCEEENKNREYEIIESDDGFYRVRKIGNDRTIRKFSTRMEAENYIEKRGLTNDR